MIDKVEDKADVGVIVGRFQVHKLHKGHRELIKSVTSEHKKVIILLGISPIPMSPLNPLDFESRKKMIEKKFPQVTILYILDHPSDEVWSRNLDQTVGAVIGPNQTAALYGSRDSFMRHYSGRFPVVELVASHHINGTKGRTEIGQFAGHSPAWRAGAIWASQQCYPTVFPTVDVAIFKDRLKPQLLLGRKPNAELWQLPGVKS